MDSNSDTNGSISEELENEELDNFDINLENTRIPWNRSTRNSLSSENNDNDEDEFDENDQVFPWYNYQKGEPDNISHYSGSSSKLKTGKKMLKDITKKSEKSLSNIIKNLLITFKNRENQLTYVVEEAKFHTIEHFLEVEFEKQRVDLTEVLRSAVFDVNFIDTNDINYTNTINIWYKKAIIKYENFAKRVRVIRSAFLRTNDFFREMSDNSIKKLEERHEREVAIVKAKQSMTSNKGITPEQHLLFTQIRERHTLEISNMREINDKTSAREIKLLEFHLSCTEEIILKDIAMYKKLIELQLANEKKIQNLIAIEKNEKILRNNDYKRNSNNRIKELQFDLLNQDQSQIANNRISARDSRHNDFLKNGKSVSSDTLYRLTFNTKNTDYVSDSMIDSDDSIDDINDDVSSISCNIPIEVLLLEKKMKKDNKLQKQLLNKEFELKINNLKKHNRIEKNKFKKELQKEIDNIHKNHSRLMDTQTNEWIKYKTSIEKTHKISIETLINKHFVDTHILLESNREQNQTTILKSDIKAQREMSSHVFHECRNVLACMMAIADSIEDSSKSDLTILAQRQRTICEYAVDTMNNMLDIVNYQGGVYSITPTHVALSEIVNKVIDIQGNRVKTNIKIIPTFSDHVVSVDQHMIVQFMVNLLSNSSKFTTDGTITVVAFVNKDTIITENDKFVKVIFGVADTGIGMNPDTYLDNDDDNKMIISNNTTDSTNEYLVRNSGYGLYLSKLIAKNLETNVNLITPLPYDHWTRSNTQNEFGGPGSFTYISLLCENIISIKDKNIKTAFENTILNMKWIFKPKGTINILVADDQQFVRLSLFYLLGKLANKYTETFLNIKSVRSIEEALRLVSIENFDIIFVDQHYDQTTMYDTNDNANDNTNNIVDLPILKLSANVNTNSKIHDFTKNEIFINCNGDGKLTGCNFLEKYTGNAICIFASGSPLLSTGFDLIISKPYNLEILINNFEKAYNNSTMKKKLIFEKTGAYLKNNKDVILYQYE